MIKYLDERGDIITEKQLYSEYLNLPQKERIDKDFKAYIKECCGKNGTLEKIS